MKILVLESSPHRNGSSNLLAEHFVQGVKETGHPVTVFDVARANLHLCLGCDACGLSTQLKMVIDRFYSFYDILYDFHSDYGGTFIVESRGH